MILIFSDSWDHSTREVITWLDYTVQKYELIVDEDNISTKVLFNQHETHIVIGVNDKYFNRNELKACWYRRGKGLFISATFIENKILQKKRF